VGIFLSRWTGLAPDGIDASSITWGAFVVKNLIPVTIGNVIGDEEFTVFDWLNTIIGNVKNKLLGTYHGMQHKHLPRYLGEFCFRFNRRFKLPNLLNSLIHHSANAAPIPQRELKLAEDWW
jgi:hypothetical protein